MAAIGRREQRQAQWVLLPCRTESARDRIGSSLMVALLSAVATQRSWGRPDLLLRHFVHPVAERRLQLVGVRHLRSSGVLSTDSLLACLRPSCANRTDGSRALGLLCAQPRSAHMGGRAVQRRPLRYVGRTD